METPRISVVIPTRHRDDTLAQCLNCLRPGTQTLAVDQYEYEVIRDQTTCLAGVRSPLMHAPINTTGGWPWSCNMMVRRAFFEPTPFDESFPSPHMERHVFPRAP